MQVRLTNGELTVWWPNQDTPVAKLKGHWRGPIPPSTGPLNEEPCSSRPSKYVHLSARSSFPTPPALSTNGPQRSGHRRMFRRVGP